MAKLFLFLALYLAAVLGGYSQITFEKGYFINEDSKRTDCLIKNVDWENNPTEFEYRLSADTEIKKASIQEVKEFGINGVTKYIRTLVQLDRSSNNLTKLTTVKNPVFHEERLFLKVLIEGGASLLRYTEGGSLTRYFYISGDTTKQLVYKRYLTKEDKIAENNYFRQQLFTDLTCLDITLQDVEQIDYKENELARFVIKYNECSNSGFVLLEKRQKKDLINLTIRPGLGINNLSIRHPSSDLLDVDISGIGFGLGIETEFILPFNKNKWALVVEPAFQYFQAETTKETDGVSGGILVSGIDYKSLEVPLSLRHSFFIKNTSKIFLDVSYVFSFGLNSKVEFTRADGSVFNSYDIETAGNVAFGAGYKHGNRYSLQVRYQANRELLANMYWTSSYNSLSVILGYSLF